MDEEKPIQAGQGAASADLRTQLRQTLIEQFAAHLSKCKSVSTAQSKRLTDLVTEDSVSASAILAALTEGRKEQLANG
jgi:hypothetical protein